jgi:hypothetical protein
MSPLYACSLTSMGHDDRLVISGKLFTLKAFQFRLQKSVSDIDFLFTFNVYHMADKDESDLVNMILNESETDSNPRKRQGNFICLSIVVILPGS